MVDDPSVEDKGGFEFASGMDIFSEPGVLKACQAMEEVTYGASAAPTAIPLWADDVQVGGNNTIYVAAGAKILESINGGNFTLFLTNGNGNNLGLRVFDGYVYYADDAFIGRAPVNDGASKNDSYNACPGDTEFRPMLVQGGTLKVGSGRYVSSVAEGGAVTDEAMKLPSQYDAKALADYLTRLFIGTKSGNGDLVAMPVDASVFDWRGTVLSSGSALPDNPYPVKMRGMNALLADGDTLYGFPDSLRHVYYYSGATFKQLRRINSDAISVLAANPGAVSQHQETVLFSGSFLAAAGVFQMKNGAICQAFVPEGLTPGATATINIGFVKSTFGGLVLMGYHKDSDNSYHIEKTSTTKKQNSAFVRSLWHRHETDRMKRHIGVKLNLKPLATGCSVAVHYRTTRDAAFTDSGFTVTSSNQDKPVTFTAQPRSREIQYKFVYTCPTG